MTETVRKSEDSACCYRSVSNSGLRVLFEVTSRCNLRCQHCFVKPSTSKELSTQQTIRLIDEMSTLGVKKLLVSGGEPLLRHDLFDILRYSIEKGILIDLVTNATLIDEDVSLQLADIGITEATISLDGATPLTHDIFRGKEGAFTKTVKAIQSLQAVGVKIDISSVPTKINIREIPQIIDLSFKLNADSLAFAGLILLGRARTNSARLALSSSQLQSFADLVNRKRIEYGSSMPIRTTRVIKTDTLEECCAGKTIIGIDSDGMVNPCPLLKIDDGRATSLKTSTLLEIMDSEEFNTIRRLVQSENVCNPACCLSHKCGKGCRGIAKIYYNNILAPDPLCRKIRRSLYPLHQSKKENH